MVTNKLGSAVFEILPILAQIFALVAQLIQFSYTIGLCMVYWLCKIGRMRQFCHFHCTSESWKTFRVRGTLPPWPPTRGSAPGPRWGLRPQTPVIGSRYARSPWPRPLLAPQPSDTSNASAKHWNINEHTYNYTVTFLIHFIFLTRVYFLYITCVRIKSRPQAKCCSLACTIVKALG